MYSLAVAYSLVSSQQPIVFNLPHQYSCSGYYNEARILDPVTFATVNVLPNIPGSVMSFIAGRTYPMEGASVLLPQYAPYTAPVTVLICGGSDFGAALDNCVSIQPESNNATWVIERMVRSTLLHLIETSTLINLRE